MSLFIGKLMDAMYSFEYMGTHSMTGKAASVDNGEKEAINQTELNEIISKSVQIYSQFITSKAVYCFILAVIQRRYPATNSTDPHIRQAAIAKQETEIRKRIRQKLQNVAAKWKAATEQALLANASSLNRTTPNTADDAVNATADKVNREE